MKKIIGVVLRPDKNDTKRYVSKINDSIRIKLSSYDINLIGIIPKSSNLYLSDDEKSLDIESLEEILEICDGVVMPGGYGPFDYDYKVVDYCYKNDIPLFGICLGMQVMGEYLGGKLKKVSNQLVHHNKKILHEARISRNSNLYEMIQSDIIYVNSRHQEMITGLDKSYIAARYCKQIEAVNEKSKRFFLGVQWHPEDMETNHANKIFDGFIDSIRKK